MGLLAVEFSLIKEKNRCVLNFFKATLNDKEVLFQRQKKCDLRISFIGKLSFTYKDNILKEVRI